MTATTVAKYTLCNFAELQSQIPDWNVLAKNAVEANPFYEPAVLLAAVRNLFVADQFYALLIRSKQNEQGNSQLIGLVPFLGGSSLSARDSGHQLFGNLHCYLNTPLFHRDFVDICAAGLLNWLRGNPLASSTLTMEKVDQEGAVVQSLMRLQGKQHCLLSGQHARALIDISCADSATDFCQGAISARKLKEYRRQQRRLSEQGDLQFQQQNSDPEQRWVEAFLRLEASGWKGRRGFAMDNNFPDSGFMLDLINEMGARQQLMLQTLTLDGKPIAMKCNLIAANQKAGFAFKIAYDERYAQYSPGLLLELFNIEQMFSRNCTIEWMDSCADPQHPMIDHLWRQRRAISTVHCVAKTWRGRHQKRRLHL